jgi:hypothetical protein
LNTELQSAGLVMIHNENFAESSKRETWMLGKCKAGVQSLQLKTDCSQLIAIGCKMKLPAAPLSAGQCIQAKANQLAINISAEADFNNPNSEILILNGINNSIITLTDAVAILTGKFFTAGGPWIFFQELNPIYYSFQILFGNRTQVFNS